MTRVTMKLSDRESVTRDENQALVFYGSIDRGIADSYLESFRYGKNLEVERD